MSGLTRKVAIGVVVLGLAAVGLTGYLLGQKSAIRADAELNAPGPAPHREADGDRQRAWQQIVAALARPVDPDETRSAERPGEHASGDPAAELNGAQSPVEEPPPMTAIEERERAVARLRESGPDQLNLAKRAEVVGNVWAELAEKRGSPAQVGPWECHAAGCAATLVQQSETEIEDLTNEISLQDDFRSWEGPKMRSGPIKRPDGTTEVTWILYAGDEGATEQGRGR